MGTPERYDSNYQIPQVHRGSEEEDGTIVGDDSLQRELSNTQSHLTVDEKDERWREPSRSRVREEANRLNDDLAMLKVERQVSEQAKNDLLNPANGEPVQRSRSRRTEPTDEFDIATQPLHQHASIYKPAEAPSNSVAKLFKKIHNSSFIIRYFTYIVPVVAILLTPVLLGALQFDNANVGGVKLLWFGVWLEIVWLTLWAGRILAKCLPYPIGLITSLFTNNSKKWRDMAKQLELPATLFFWILAVEISFLPTMTNHHINGSHRRQEWENTMNQVLICLLIAAILNFVQKIIIQLIAISFHLRTYSDRIELNKFQIGSLAKLYKYSKERIIEDDSDFEEEGGDSGAQTPGMMMKKAQKTTKEAIGKFGDVAGKIAGDFTGRQITGSEHPNQVTLALLGSPEGSQVLARRLYRTFAREETQTVHSDDLKNAFESDEEAEAAFSMFDKDMNGDISMEELEAVCVEIGRERKSITASLKDLDSVVSKLDDIFMFIVLIIVILVFVSVLATSATAVIASAGSTLLALSWLFSATAQEFLQSIIFVFVKHPYDVGDRVTVYGNSGSMGMGDDYFVKEIALLYTEFKKMEGHVVQAPNSYLNTLFILNQRRSGALAEAIPVVIKFGTTIDQIDALRQRLVDFVVAEKREYKSNILTELRDVTEAHQMTLNIIFFYKSNWQNELLRLQRRNKFICAMMVAMQELDIEGPRMRYPGMKESFPVYLSNVPHIGTPGAGHGGHPDNPQGIHEDANAPTGSYGNVRSPSSRPRGDTVSSASKRYDFSLGMSDLGVVDPGSDVFDDRKRRHVPISVTSPSPNRNRTSSERRSAERRSADVGRSSSVSANDMPRIRSTHRNRFFGTRARGVSDVESAMADIPEHSTPGMSGANNGHRLDPRTGQVSDAAYRVSEDSRLDSSRRSDDVPQIPQIRGPQRSFTSGL